MYYDRALVGEMGRMADTEGEQLLNPILIECWLVYGRI
jgi:hypothetical protein